MPPSDEGGGTPQVCRGERYTHFLSRFYAAAKAVEEYIMREKHAFLECAQAVNTHGIKGAVRLASRCDSPSVLASLKTMYLREGDGYRAMPVVHASVQKNMVLATFAEVDTLEKAIALRDKIFYAKREDLPLPAGAHFVADLLGLPVIDTDSGQACGVLEDVTFPGAHPVYVVRDGDHCFMIPAVPAFILDISFGQDRPEGIYVRLIEGMREG